MWTFRTTSLVALSLSIVGANSAAAQSADHPSPSSDAALTEIIVTAQKRAAPLQDVPVAVTAFTGDAIRSSNLDALTGLRGLVPGMTISRSGAALNTPQISLRGISLQDPNRAVESGIGFTIDGVPLAFQRGTLLDAFDIERLEVLRGPQGLLFGRNTTGGTVNVIRSRPDPDAPTTGKLRATYGSFNRTDFEGVVMGPIVPGLLAFKAGISVKKHDGEFRNNITGSQEGKRDMRDYLLALEATPSDRTKVYLSLERMEDDSEVPPYVPVMTADLIRLGGPKLLTPNGLGTLGYPTYVTGQDMECLNPATAIVCRPIDVKRNDVETTQFPAYYNLSAATLEIEHELDGVKLVSLSGYREDAEDQLGDFDATRFALQRNDKRESSWQLSQELRAETQFNGPINFVAGAFFIDYAFTARQFPSVDAAGLSAKTAPGTAYFNSVNAYLIHQKSRSFALFLQGDWDITDKLRLTAGARQTWDRKQTSFTLWTKVASTVRDQFFLGPQQGPVGASVRFDELTPRIGLQYKVTPDLLVYANWSRGYNAGGFNGRAGSIANAVIPYRPEIMDAYEVGFKSEWLDHRVRLNVAAFHNTLKDKQEDVLTVAPGGGIVTATVNAAKARYRGIEAELALAPVRGWTITGSAGYLEAKYLSFTGNLAGQGLADLTGLKLRRTPQWTAGAISDYAFDLGGGKAGLNAAIYYTDRYETSVLNDPRGSIPPVTKIDLAVRYAFPVNDKLRMTLTGFVKNVTDNTTYDGFTSSNTVQSFIDFAIPSVGRTWGVSLGAEF